MKIVIASDHGGFQLKSRVKDRLVEKSIEVVDAGPDTPESCDYSDYALEVAKAVSGGRYDRGILICGTGAGMAIAANKVPGVRAVCVTDPYTAERAIASNDAHVVTFGAQITGLSVARMLADIFIRNSFQGGRSAPKVAKLAALDEAR